MNIREIVRLAFLIALVPVPSMGVEYFPSECDCTLTYNFFERISVYDRPGGVVVLDNSGGEIDSPYDREFYWVSEVGDVRLLKNHHFLANYAGIDSLTYEPSLLYLDFPLTTGKTWVSNSLITGEDGHSYWVILTAEVVGPAIVSVPAGEFEVIAVNYDYVYPTEPAFDRTEELWFHIQLGKVNGLTSWSGIVSTVQSTWGGVKALYR